MENNEKIKLFLIDFISEYVAVKASRQALSDIADDRTVPSMSDVVVKYSDMFMKDFIHKAQTLDYVEVCIHCCGTGKFNCTPCQGRGVVLKQD